jgi:hypothetical protein
VVRPALSRFGRRWIRVTIRRVTLRGFAAIVAAALRDIHFAADDGLDVALAGFVEEICGGEKIAVVISIEEYEKILEELEDLEDLRACDEARALGETAIPLEQALAENRRNRK